MRFPTTSPMRCCRTSWATPIPGSSWRHLTKRATWSGATATLNVVDHAVVTTLAERAGSTLSWLSGFGVRFDALPTAFLTTSTTRLMPVGGGLALVEDLTRAAQERGVRFLFETTARSLITEEARVPACGSSAAEGPADLLGFVVLACGGYEGNSEMLARYHGEKGMLCRARRSRWALQQR